MSLALPTKLMTCGKDIDQGRLIYVPAMVKTVDLLFLFMSCALFILWRFRFRCQTTECDHDLQFCEPAKPRNGMSIFCWVSRFNALLSQSVISQLSIEGERLGSDGSVASSSD